MPLNRYMQWFAAPTIVTIVGLIAMYWWGGATAFAVAALLVGLEVTLSFDNAVVNAKVLARLSEKWQRRFLTWGIFVSVVLVRALLPIVIVALSTGTSLAAISHIALYDSVRYGELLRSAHYIISSFGGTFLLLVGLRYFIDQEKEVHWMQAIERRLAAWGTVESAVIGVVLCILFIAAVFVPEHRAEVLFSGLSAALVFIFLRGIVSAFNVESVQTHHVGFILFVYLNVLDAAFSLDGVVGAFALTTQLPVIIVGLGTGAYFVRSLTLYMVRHKVLEGLAYIEHGAHWAIVGLGASMFVNMFIDLPEPITGLIGLVFVTFAYVSSVRVENVAA